MEEIIKEMCALMELKSTSFSHKKTETAPVRLFLKQSPTDTEKDKLNIARKKLLALNKQCLDETSNAQQNVSLINMAKEIITTTVDPPPNNILFTRERPKSPTFHILNHETDEIRDSNGSAEKNNNINVISSSDEEDIVTVSSDEELISQCDKISKQYLQKSVQEQNITLNKSVSFKMPRIKKEQMSLGLNSKKIKDKEDIPFLEINQEIQILEALKQQISETNTLPSDEFVPPLFQPKPWKVKNMKEIAKPGKPLENKINDHTVNPFSVISPHVKANKTRTNGLENILTNVASKSIENPESISREDDFAPISPIEPPAHLDIENVFRFKSDNFYISEEISEKKTDISRISNYSTNSPTISNNRLDVPVNPDIRKDITALPTPPYTGFDYPTTFRNVDSSFTQTINTTDPQFRPSDDIPMTSNYSLIKSNPLQTSSNPFESLGEAPFTTNRPNIKDMRKAGLLFEKKCYNYVAIRREDKAQHKDIYNMGSDFRNRYHNNYLKSYRIQSEENIYRNERNEHYSRYEITRHHHNNMDSPHSEFRRRSYDHKKGFEYPTENYNNQRYQRPFEHRRQRAASIDRNVIRINTQNRTECVLRGSNTHYTQWTSPLLKYKSVESAGGQNLEQDSEKTNKINVKTLDGNKPNCKSVSNNYKKSKENNSSIQDKEEKDYSRSRHRRNQLEKNPFKPVNQKQSKKKPDHQIENKKPGISGPNSKIYNNTNHTSFMSSRIDRKHEQPEVSLPSEFISKKRTKKLKVMHTVQRIKNSDTKIKISKLKKKKKKDKGDDYAKKTVIKTQEKVSVSKAKRRIIYSDSDSETIQAKSGHCPRSSDKLLGKNIFLRKKKAKKVIKYSDSDSETMQTTKEGPEQEHSLHFTYSSKYCCKGSFEMANDLQKPNQKLNSNEVMEPDTTSILCDVKQAQNIEEKSTATVVNEKFMKQCAPKRIIKRKKNKYSAYCNEKDVNSVKYVEVIRGKKYDTVPKETCTKTNTLPQLCRTYPSELERTQSCKISLNVVNLSIGTADGTNKSINIDKCQNKSENNGERSNTSERNKLLSDDSSSSHLNEYSVEYSVEDSVSECIKDCLSLAQDLLQDVPTSIFLSFIHNLCVNRTKEDIPDVVSTIESKMERDAFNDAISDTESRVLNGKLKVNFLKIQKAKECDCKAPIVQKANSKEVRELSRLVQLDNLKDSSGFKTETVSQRLRPRTSTKDEEQANQSSTLSKTDFETEEAERLRSQLPKSKLSNSEFTEQSADYENTKPLHSTHIYAPESESNEIIQGGSLNEKLCPKPTIQSKLTIESNAILNFESKEQEIKEENTLIEINSSEKNVAMNQAQPISNEFDGSHFKVIHLSPNVKKYVCCINGTDNHYTTALLPALLVHVKKKHAEVWDGYCSVCRKTLTMSQEEHNFVTCLEHMLNRHNMVEFPVLQPLEATSRSYNSSRTLNAELETPKFNKSNGPRIKPSSMLLSYAHFKIDCTDFKSQKYVCCIGENNAHFKTVQKISMINHLRANHPEEWNGFCYVCKKVVMPQGLHNFWHYFKHMVANHLDNFPVLDQVEANQEISLPISSIDAPPISKNSADKSNQVAEECYERKENELLKNVFETAKVISLSEDIKETSSVDSPPQLAKQRLPTANSILLNILSKSKKDEIECNSKAIETKKTFNSLPKDANLIDKKELIISAGLSQLLVEKDSCKPKRQYLEYEEQQARVMKAKHHKVLTSMISEIKLAHIYKCAGRFCVYTTNLLDKAELHAISHQKVNKRDKSVLMCAYCDFDCKGEAKSLVNHVFKTHGQCKYSCSQCFYRAAASQLVYAHMQRVHGSTKEVLEAPTPVYDLSTESLSPEFEVMGYLCANKDAPNPECQQPCYTKESFVNHLRNHTSPYFCFICAHSAVHPTDLLVHLSNHGLKQFHCSWCSHGADSKEDFLAHFSARHPARKPTAFTRNVTGIHESTKQTSVLPLVEFNESSIAIKLVTLNSNEKNSDSENNLAVREADKSHNLEELITGLFQGHEPHFGDSEILGVSSSEQTLSQPLPTTNVIHSNNLLSAVAEVNPFTKRTQNIASNDAKLIQILIRTQLETETSDNMQKCVRMNAPISFLDLCNAKDPGNSTVKQLSLEAASGYPKYVPDMRRYICGAKDCLHTAIDKATLKHHWETLHSSNDFKCVHCQSSGASVSLQNWTQIEEHLNMHSDILFVCATCNAYHYRYEIVEKHIKIYEGAVQLRAVSDQCNTPVGDVAISTTSTIPMQSTDLTNTKKPIKKGTNKKRANDNKTTRYRSKRFKCTECECVAKSELNTKKHKYETHRLNDPNVVGFHYFDAGKTVPELPGEYADKTKKQTRKPKQNNVHLGQSSIRPGPKLKMSDSSNVYQKGPVSHKMESILAPSVKAWHDLAIQAEQETLKSIMEVNNAYMFSNSYLNSSNVQPVSNEVLADPSGLHFNNRCQEKSPVAKEVNFNGRPSQDYIQQVESYNPNHLKRQLWKCPHPYCPFKTCHSIDMNEHLIRHRMGVSSF